MSNPAKTTKPTRRILWDPEHECPVEAPPSRAEIITDVLDAIRTRAVAAERRGDEVTARVLYELCEEIAWRGVP